MTASVTLLTERQHVAQQWTDALSEERIAARVVSPTELGSAVQGQLAVVVDVEETLYADDLLSTLAFVRANGAMPIVHVERDRHTLEDIITELCHGLITSCAEDVTRVVSALPRRADAGRHLRFEFVTVSPYGDEILAVLGNGEAALHARPVDASDDGSEIADITIDPSASMATLRLKSGAVCRLGVGAVQTSAAMSHGDDDIAIDGEKLGARLRELRLAAGLTQAELARRTGIHRPNIARVEAGRHTPSLETLARIANAIGVSTTHVLVSRQS
ncbi:MAG: helix-turn-helix transcriptional regulator [Polyangiales bacterium]